MTDTLPTTPRVLHIEDNVESRALVRRVLESRGFEVMEASDGLAGIDLAIRQHPDLILIDIALPGIDGYENGDAIALLSRARRLPDRGADGRGRSWPVAFSGLRRLYRKADRGLQVRRSRCPRVHQGQARESPCARGAAAAFREYSQSLSERVEATVRELSQANAQKRRSTPRAARASSCRTCRTSWRRR